LTPGCDINYICGDSGSIFPAGSPIRSHFGLRIKARTGSSRPGIFGLKDEAVGSLGSLIFVSGARQSISPAATVEI